MKQMWFSPSLRDNFLNFHFGGGYWVILETPPFQILPCRHSLIALLVTSSKEDLAEGGPEVGVEYGIDDRVK